MAWTQTTLYAAIAAYLQDSETSFTTTYVPIAVLQAEDRISKSAIMPMNRKNGTLSLSTGVATAAVPADFLAPFELRMIVSGVYSPVYYADVSIMRESYPNPSTTGTPKWYSMYDSTTAILAPSPATGVTSWLNYFYKPASITSGSGSTTTWLGTNAENCLLYACLSEAYTFLKGDPDLQTLYETKYQAALADLKTLGEGLDLGDAYRMSERRLPR